MLIQTAKVFDGDIIERPEDPLNVYAIIEGVWYIKEWSFDHWEVDGAEYDFSTPVTKDLNIVAVMIDHPAVIITNLEELVNFQKNYKKAAISKTVPENLQVHLKADIDMTGTTWDSIGLTNGSTNNPSYAFTSTFDGHCHRISNVTFSDLSEGGTIGDINNYRGFFGYITDGVVKNLTISGNGFGDTPPSGEYGCALIVGRMTTTVKSSDGGVNPDVPVLIENCVAEGTVTGTHNTAGIAVHVCAGTLKNCVNKSTVIGKYTKVGGISSFVQGQQGLSIKVDFINCANEGSVTATDNTSKGGRDGVGGIIGYSNYLLLTMDGCVNKGVVSRTDTALSSAIVGQFIGQMSNFATIKGVNKCLPLIKTVGVYQNGAKSGDNWPSGWNFAINSIDSDGLVALVKDEDVVSGHEYRATMTSKAPYKMTVQNVPLPIDERMLTANIVSGVDGYNLSKTQDGVMTTYKLVKNT